MHGSEFPASAANSLIEGYCDDFVSLAAVLAQTLEQISMRGIPFDKSRPALERIERGMRNLAEAISALLSQDRPSATAAIATIAGAMAGGSNAGGPIAGGPIAGGPSGTAHPAPSHPAPARPPAARSPAPRPSAPRPAAPRSAPPRHAAARQAPPNPAPTGMAPARSEPAHPRPAPAAPPPRGKPPRPSPARTGLPTARPPRPTSSTESPLLDGQRDTAGERPEVGPGLKGTNQSMPLLSVCQFLGRMRKSGTLHVAIGDEKLTFEFDKGYIQETSSPGCPPQERIGELLVSMGFCSHRDLEPVLTSLQDNHERVGQLAFERGLVSNGQLMEALERQVQQRFERACKNRTASYEFEDGACQPRDGRIHIAPFELAFQQKQRR